MHKDSLAKFGYKQEMIFFKKKKGLSILHVFGYMLEANREFSYHIWEVCILGSGLGPHIYYPRLFKMGFRQLSKYFENLQIERFDYSMTFLVSKRVCNLNASRSRVKF